MSEYMTQEAPACMPREARQPVHDDPTHWSAPHVDVRHDRSQRGLRAMARGRGWMHADGERARSPEMHERQRLRFEELEPEPLPPSTGLPRPVGEAALKFVAKRERGQRRAHMLWTTRDGELGDGVIGQEVDRLYQWMHAQRALVEPIGAIEPVMRTLQANGILDDDFRVAHGEHIDPLLHAVARSGRADAYPTRGRDRSSDMLRAGRVIDQTEADAIGSMADLGQYGVKVKSLHARIRGVRAAAASAYARDRARHEATQLSRLMREKTEMLLWLDAFAGVVMHWGTAFKGVISASTPANAATVASGATGAITTVSGLVVHAVYAREFAEARGRIGTLKQRARALDASHLSAQLDALVIEMNGYVELAGRLREVTNRLGEAQAKAYADIGSLAGDAVADMSAIAGGPFAARSRLDHGRIQRLFANIPLYEQIAAFDRRASWPRLEGEIPMSGFLHWTRESKVVSEAAVEAAKLRWWRDRTPAIASLWARLRTSIESIGPLARSLK